MARVTIHGILVDGYYYSCSHAIRNNWYAFAIQSSEKSVFVVMHPEDKESIYVYIEEQNIYVHARRITLPLATKVSIEQYHQKFQSIIEELNNIKKK